MIKNIFVAFGTISKIPVPYIKNIDIKKSTIYFPLVGYAAFLLLWGTDFIFSKFFPEEISSILIMFLYFFIFQYFHFDGLLDIIDGFGAQVKTKEQRLKIMKDPNVGAFALLYGVIYLMIYFFAFKNLTGFQLIYPIFSRFFLVGLIAFCKPAKNEGLASYYYPYPKRYFLYSSIFVIPLLFLDISIFLKALLAFFISFIFVKIISNKKIGGITGDVLGGGACIYEIILLLIMMFKY
jgi:adenosylcobinamide-GDP ribazoletransferase